MLKNVFFIAIFALVFALQSAKSEELCDMYSVAPGDTLRLISERYYGTRDLSPVIYAANLETVGEDPNIIEIGTVLGIPCRVGITIPVSYSFFEPNQITQQNPSPYFLARPGAAPFIDDHNLGVIPAILASALRNGGFTAPLNIIRPADNRALLEQAPTSDAALSFPWIKPDCTSNTALSAQSVDICANYTFSKPLFEITLGLFTNADSPLTGATSPLDFKNSRFCMAAFYDVSLPPAISQVQRDTLYTFIAPSNTDCVEGLVQGRFDLILSDYQTMKPQQGTLISDMPAYAHLTTLHAMAHNANPQGLAVLEMANLGLVRILESGEWFEIVNGN